jgi:hypothetical protein
LTEKLSALTGGWPPPIGGKIDRIPSKVNGKLLYPSETRLVQEMIDPAP